jgi:hypothetical protein
VPERVAGSSHGLSTQSIGQRRGARLLPSFSVVTRERQGNGRIKRSPSDGWRFSPAPSVIATTQPAWSAPPSPFSATLSAWT